MKIVYISHAIYRNYNNIVMEDPLNDLTELRHRLPTMVSRHNHTEAISALHLH